MRHFKMPRKAASQSNLRLTQFFVSYRLLIVDRVSAGKNSTTVQNWQLIRAENEKRPVSNRSEFVRLTASETLNVSRPLSFQPAGGKLTSRAMSFSESAEDFFLIIWV
jgi:hypothetical protein